MPEDLDAVLKNLSKEDIDEMMEEVEKEVEEQETPKPKPRKPRGRAPDAPKSNEHIQRRAIEKAREGVKNDFAPEIFPAEPVTINKENPRYSNSPEAEASVRREQVWKRRQEEGYGEVRRKIFDDRGQDTGATTSSLE